MIKNSAYGGLRAFRSSSYIGRRPVITFSGLARDSETHMRFVAWTRYFRDASAGLRKKIEKLNMKSKGRACVPPPSGRRADASP